MTWKLVERQKQWLAEEKGAVLKDWGVGTRIALAFPNRYAVGMSNLGFQSVYGFLNQREDVVCERVFYPEPDDLKLVRGHPGELLSVESQKPVRDFHLLAFSVPFENDYTNVLDMLAMASIPLRASERDAGYPLVAASGVAVFLNPEPLSAFVDFFFIGEAEALLPDFWAFWDGVKDREIPRADLLKALAREVQGIYVPSLYEVSYRRDGTLEAVEPSPGIPERVAYRRADIAAAPVCRTFVHTPNTEFSNVTLMEIGRGCGRGCRFCAAGYVYRPPRYQPAEKLVETARSQFAESPRVGLVSAAVSDHPEVDALCHSLISAGASLSFSSLRADSVSEEVLAALQESRHQAVAIAPEAGSERLRRVINKHLTTEQIYSAAERLAQAGIMNIKLYFMVGLPTETLEDLQGIVELAKGIKHHVLKKSRGRKQLGTITLSVNSFVPKPFTPFQWVGFAGVRELKERARWIQKALQKVPNVRVHFDLPKWAYVQAVLARADRRADLLLLGALSDNLSWSRALKTVPFNPDFWALRERDRDERFPWEIIDHGVDRAYLWKEYEKGIEARESPACTVEQKCRRCGVCLTWSGTC